MGLFIKPLLDALVTVNRLYLRSHHVPPLYTSGVRYKQEPEDGKPEEFASIAKVLERGWGDCDDLAPWRVAELQEAGDGAKIRITWRRRRGGRRLYHVLVRRGDGRIEDPSRLLGM
ncbi:MAG TPA: hypothetical protein VG937_00080 [Polyangiaceae bacterium]|nr:hypothetical protein [Polyangiaceae bacterium]